MEVRTILVGIVIIVTLSLIVSAGSFSTSPFSTRANPTETAYKVTYTIEKPGWYLLPHQESIISLSQDTGDFVAFYKSVDYKYALSPFTKKYVRCVERPNTNPLVCDTKGVYGVSEDFLMTLSEESFAQDYRAYTSLSADWHYYSKPTRVVYEYHPYMLVEIEGDNIGLFGAKLKSGWNLITYPSHAAYGDITIGNCNIERIYGWNDEIQDWEAFPDLSRERLVDELTDGRGALSGMGMAIKVTNDCTLLKEGDEGEIVAPPAIPGSGTTVIGNACSTNDDCPPVYGDWTCKNSNTATRFVAYHSCKQDGTCGSSPGGVENKNCVNGCLNGDCI